MAEYRPLLISAISRLDVNTPKERQAVYARVRAALHALMGPADPSLAIDEKYDRERCALEDAITTVESSVLDAGEINASAASEEPFPALNFQAEQDQAPEDASDSTTTSEPTLGSPSLSSENYRRAWLLFQQSWRSFRAI
jgi:hypothetical protein